MEKAAARSRAIRGLPGKSGGNAPGPWPSVLRGAGIESPPLQDSRSRGLFHFDGEAFTPLLAAWSGNHERIFPGDRRVKLDALVGRDRKRHDRVQANRCGVSYAVAEGRGLSPVNRPPPG